MHIQFYFRLKPMSIPNLNIYIDLFCLTKITVAQDYHSKSLRNSKQLRYFDISNCILRCHTWNFKRNKIDSPRFNYFGWCSNCAIFNPKRGRFHSRIVYTVKNVPNVFTKYINIFFYFDTIFASSFVVKEKI